MLKYYRFFNRKYHKYGSVFAICDAHLPWQHVPKICTMHETKLSKQPSNLTCAFCDVEQWKNRK